MRRERPEADPDPTLATEPAPSLTPVQPARPDRRLGTSLGLAVALLLLAIAKPWGEAGPGPSRVAPVLPTPPPTRGPAATDDLSPDGLAAPVCLGAGVWRVASLESWRTQDVRVWRAIQPATSATGPLDPAIPSVPLVAVRVTALGWCAPSFGPERPVGPVNVGAWRVRDGVASPLLLGQVQPAGSTPLAALYIPLASCPAEPACSPGATPTFGEWAAERVVFRWQDLGAGATAWFAADVELTPPAGPPSPPVAGTPAPG